MGLYQVSNLGRVRSLPRVVERSNGATQTVKGGFLTPTPTPDGHMQVRLSDKTGVCHEKHFKAKVSLPRTVAQGFGLTAPEGNATWVVKHKDGDHTNCALDNLCWGPPVSESCRASVSASNTHRKVSDETHAKIRAASFARSAARRDATTRSLTA